MRLSRDRLAPLLLLLAGCSDTITRTRVVGPEHVRGRVQYHDGDTLPDGKVVHVESSPLQMGVGGILFATGAVLASIGFVLIESNPTPPAVPCYGWDSDCGQQDMPPQARAGTFMSVIGAAVGVAGLVLFAIGTEPRARARSRVRLNAASFAVSF